MALIETFSDGFTNLSAWQATFFASVSPAATAGQFVVSFSGAPSEAGVDTTVTTFDFDNSWFSAEFVDYDGATAGEPGFFFGPAPSDLSAFDAMITISYLVATDEVKIVDVFASQTPVVISNPGVPIVVGCRITAGSMDWSYSIDSGASWTPAFTMAYALTDPNSLALGASSGAGTGTAFNMIADNVNLYEPAVPGVNIATPVAIVTVVAIPHTSITIGDPYITFPPAVVAVNARVPVSVVVGPGAPVIDIYPAQVNVVAHSSDPIVGSFLVGDPFAYPFVIRESGTQAFDLTGYTLETDEPFTGETKSLWIAYQADAPMQVTVTATSSDAFNMEMFDGDALVGLTYLGAGPAISTDINTGLVYIRLTSSANATVTLTWTYDPVSHDLMMDVLTPLLDHTPDTIKVSVIGGVPGESVRFTWSPPVSSLIPVGTTRPIVLATVSSDFEGNILTATLPLQAAPAGSYILEARGVTSGRASNGTFKILNAPLTADSAGVDISPVPSASVKWMWDDGVEDPWVMPKNPDTMTSVVQTKVLTAERTTGGAGQHIIWQGAKPAFDWTLKGTITTQDEREALEYYEGLKRKFYITTHRNVTYTVTFKNLDLQPKRNGDNFETWDYTADLFIYSVTNPVKKTLTSEWDVLHL